MDKTINKLWKNNLFNKDEFINWRLFLLVAEAKSFNSVAEALNIDRSTVLRRVRALEKRIGKPLFSPNSLDLNPHGLYYQNVIANILNQYDSVFQRLNFPYSPLNAHLRIEAPTFFINEVLSTMALKFHEKHAGVTFEFFDKGFESPPDHPLLDKDVVFHLGLEIPKHAYSITSLAFGIYTTEVFANQITPSVKSISCLKGVPSICFDYLGYKDIYVYSHLTSERTVLKVKPILSQKYFNETFLSEALKSAVLLNGINPQGVHFKTMKKFIRLFPEWESPTLFLSAQINEWIPKGIAAENFVLFVQRNMR